MILLVGASDVSGPSADGSTARFGKLMPGNPDDLDFFEIAIVLALPLVGKP